IEYDQELVRRFYLNNGYADVRVVSAVAELKEGTDDFYLTFTVDEGPRYKIGEISIDSNLRNFDASALRESVTVLPGEWYDAASVEKSADSMTDKMGDLQYAFAAIRPSLKRHPETATVDIS